MQPVVLLAALFVAHKLVLCILTPLRLRELPNVCVHDIRTHALKAANSVEFCRLPQTSPCYIQLGHYLDEFVIPSLVFIAGVLADYFISSCTPGPFSVCSKLQSSCFMPAIVETARQSWKLQQPKVHISIKSYTARVRILHTG